MIPEVLHHPIFLDEVADLLEEHPGKKPAYAFLATLSPEQQLQASDQVIDFETKVKDSKELDRKLDELIEDLVEEALVIQLDRLNAHLCYTADLDDDGDTVWQIKAKRNDRVLAETYGEIYLDSFWAISILQQVLPLDYPEFFKPLNQPATVFSTSGDWSLSLVEFMEAAENKGQADLEEILVKLGVPMTHEDSCWCGSGIVRRNCHA